MNVIDKPLLFSLLAALALASSCGPSVTVEGEGEEGEGDGGEGEAGEGEGEAGEGEGEGDAVVYHRDIQPLLERSCHGCHADGGIAPFAFTTPEDAQGLAPALLDAVERGVMPPYYAKAGCRDTLDDIRLSEDEKALLRAWTEAGAPLGDIADSVHAEPVAPPTMRVDAAYDIGADFDVASLRTDDADLDVYRCFDIDFGFDADTSITAYEVLPDNKPLVHHVLAYIVSGDDVATLQAKDAEDEGLGYACESGGVGVNGAIVNLGASWVPGATVARMPDGTGIFVPAGSHLVFQVHYNVVALQDDPFDRTRLVLETSAPEGLAAYRSVPMLNPLIQIPAGEAEVVQTVTSGNIAGRLFRGATVFSATGHMHQLGTNVRLDVVHADGTEDCVIDIGPWDFNWQRAYSFVTPFPIAADDNLKITCTYDNSAENQPVVGGAQQAPRDVSWGESSLDEMCMVYLAFTGGGEGTVRPPN